MTSDTKRNSKGPVVCFIDDDEAELQRFEASMGSEFVCITGQGYEDCKRQLDAKKLKPKLWVVDLFFPSPGHTNTDEELATMNDRYAELEAKVQQFRAFLSEIRQGPEGGIELLRTCLRNHPVPVMMFTRKGMLDDAIRCLDEGAMAVLKKPMPAAWPTDPYEQKRSLDKAIFDRRPYLSDKFHEAISANNFWAKHKTIASFLVGAIISGLIQGVVRLFF